MNPAIKEHNTNKKHCPFREPYTISGCLTFSNITGMREVEVSSNRIQSCGSQPLFSISAQISNIPRSQGSTTFELQRGQRSMLDLG